VRERVGMTFGRILRAMLRQAPNVILVGEIRDLETAEIAIQAALTGHLVLSTLHTNNALGAIPRLIDLGVRPFLIPPTLKLVVAQRLVRKLCPECRQKTVASKEIAEMIRQKLSSLPEDQKKELNLGGEITVFKPQGCKKCNFEGFSGRSGLFEVLTMTDSLADILFKDVSEAKIGEEASKQGMITMEQDGLLKVLSGITTFEEVVRVAEEE